MAIRQRTQAGAATAVAAARDKGTTPRCLVEAAMRAVARAWDARLDRWLRRIGWGRGRLALIELLNGGALSSSLAALAVEEEPQLKPAEHAVAHYGAGALLADPRCAKRACAALAALEAAGVAFRLRHAHASLERSRGDDAPASPATTPGDDDDDADSVASGPSRVAYLGAGSVRSVRTRRGAPSSPGAAAVSKVPSLLEWGGVCLYLTSTPSPSCGDGVVAECLYPARHGQGSTHPSVATQAQKSPRSRGRRPGASPRCCALARGPPARSPSTVRDAASVLRPSRRSKRHRRVAAMAWTAAIPRTAQARVRRGAGVM